MSLIYLITQMGKEEKEFFVDESNLPNLDHDYLNWIMKRKSGPNPSLIKKYTYDLLWNCPIHLSHKPN